MAGIKEYLAVVTILLTIFIKAHYCAPILDEDQVKQLGKTRPSEAEQDAVYLLQQQQQGGPVPSMDEWTGGSMDPIDRAGTFRRYFHYSNNNNDKRNTNSHGSSSSLRQQRPVSEIQQQQHHQHHHRKSGADKRKTQKSFRSCYFSPIQCFLNERQGQENKGA